MPGLEALGTLSEISLDFQIINLLPETTKLLVLFNGKFHQRRDQGYLNHYHVPGT